MGCHYVHEMYELRMSCTDYVFDKFGNIALVLEQESYKQNKIELGSTLFIMSFLRQVQLYICFTKVQE